MRETWMGLCLVFLVTGCGSESPAPVKELSQIKPQKTNLVAAELLTGEMVETHYGIQSGSLKPEERSAKSSQCSYNWPKPNKEEIEAENQEKMMAYMKEMMEAQAKGEPVPKMPIVNTDNRVFFNFVSFGSSDQAASALQTIIEKMKEGITAEHEGHSATFKINYDTPVKGIGESAIWSQSHRQLAVHQDHYLMYLTVETESKAADDLEHAKSLMQLVLSAMP